jgi:hypothetical protein
LQTANLISNNSKLLVIGKDSIAAGLPHYSSYKINNKLKYARIKNNRYWG